jgi:ferric-dicitrate binding protein FerR (iron transport regulator)
VIRQTSKKSGIGLQELITKFFAEEISDSELELLKSWIEEKSVNRRIFDQENELWHVSDVKTRIEHFNPDVAWNSISSRYSLVRNRKGRIAIIKKNRIGLLVAAASVVLLILSGSVGLWIKATKSLNQLTNTSTVVTTNFGEKARIFLPDSTEVILNSGSDIRYDADYNLKERVVRLNGEAYFIVITNPAKPFVVKLDGIT